MALTQKNNEYTIDDIYALPDGQRAELIDGQMYMMAPPSRKHQQLLLSLSRKIADYIDKKGGSCEVDIAPFAVFLNNLIRKKRAKLQWDPDTITRSEASRMIDELLKG